jgi:hypothetical protein
LVETGQGNQPARAEASAEGIGDLLPGGASHHQPDDIGRVQQWDLLLDRSRVTAKGCTLSTTTRVVV